MLDKTPNVIINTKIYSFKYQNYSFISVSTQNKEDHDNFQSKVNKSEKSHLLGHTSIRESAN